LRPIGHEIIAIYVQRFTFERNDLDPVGQETTTKSGANAMYCQDVPKCGERDIQEVYVRSERIKCYMAMQRKSVSPVEFN
jgi:hypothetical protein